MRSLLFILVAATVLFASCGKDTTPNGYEFTKHTKADGPKAQPGEYAYVHIYIMADDSLLNSTREMGRPLAINVMDFSKMKEDEKGPGKSNPIADVVGLMAIGDSVSVIVPIDEQMKAAPQLQNVKKLVYNIILIDIKNEEQYQEALLEERKAIDEQIAALQSKEEAVSVLCQDMLKKYKSGALKNELKTTDTGLKYIVVEEGTGAAAGQGLNVQVHYYGLLPSGEMFDNSFSRGRPFNFKLGVGDVIAGWDQGIAKLKEGDKAVLFIPSALGYGKAGTSGIPPDSELIFYVELEKVSK